MSTKNSINKRIHLIGKILFLALALILFFFSYKTVISSSAKSIDSVEINAMQESDQIEDLDYTYQFILMDYYKFVVQTCSERGISTDMIGSYDEFCDGYYAQNDV